MTSNRTIHDGNQTDDPANTTDVKNQIVYTYNNLSQITISQQSHSGVVSGSTPKVQYVYSTTNTSGVLNSGARPVTVTYPNGRVLYSGYSGTDSLYDRLHQVKRLIETDANGTQLVDYERTGSGRAVITDYPQPDIKLDLFQGTTSTYAGLDRFGRTIDQFWDGYGSTADVARIKYGYDTASNRTWREDVIAENNTVDLDELYTYDGLNRLATVERGEINGAYTTISSDTFGQTWDLDQLNNWSNFTEDSDGDATDELDQDRTHNDVNEITAITATTGANWVDPTYDAAGNTITGPTPGDETTTQKYTYDAWNRLTKVTDGSDVTIGEYAYDGRNYRITKAVYTSGTLSHTDHFYYNENWQALEVRRETSGTEDPDPREQYVWHPDYVDALAVRYYDADTDGNLAENNDGPHYYTQGANYHVLAITNASGTVLERYHYDPYGRLSVLDADFTDDADGVSDIGNTYSFTGRRLDSESRLHYFRNRYFNSVTGRYQSRDPIDYAGSQWNLYEYVDSRPMTHTDPSGLDSTGNPMNPGGPSPTGGPNPTFPSGGWGAGPAPTADGFYIAYDDVQDPTGQACGCQHTDIVRVQGGTGSEIRTGAGGRSRGNRMPRPGDIRLRRRHNGSIQSGPAAGTPCSLANDQAIADCMQSAPTRPYGPLGAWNSCQSDVTNAALGCCMTPGQVVGAGQFVDDFITGMGGGFAF